MERAKPKPSKSRMQRTRDRELYRALYSEGVRSGDTIMEEEIMAFE